MFESYLFLGFLHPDYFEERVVLEVGARLKYQVSDRGDLFFFHGDDEPVIMDDMSTKNYRINPVVNDNGDEIGFTITSPEGYPGAVIGFSPDAYLMGAILVTKQFSKFDGEELPQQQLGNFGPFNLNGFDFSVDGASSGTPLLALSNKKRPYLHLKTEHSTLPILCLHFYGQNIENIYITYNKNLKCLTKIKI